MQYRVLLTLISAAALVIGCASQPKGLDKIREEADRAALVTASSGATLIKDAESRAADASAQETYRFAPVLTRKAMASLEEAREVQSKGKADDAVRSQALAAIATFDRAIAHTSIARETLAPALAHLEVLNAIGSPAYFPTGYQKVSESFDGIIRVLEQTGAPASTAQSQHQLLTAMHDLEVETIGFINLQEIRTTLDNLQEAGAQKLIPQSYAVARTALAAAEDLIATSPRAEGGIATLRERALNSASHAQVIMAMVNEILNASPDSAESLVLRTERWLYNIGTALKFPDIRHLPMDEQSRQLADGVEELLQR